jgi:uncharacterized protein (DUF302 family)
MSEFGYSVTVPEGYDEAVMRARLALRTEGFSILSEMHVGGLLGPQVGDERQYLIMAVWNPVMSQADIGGDLRVATHLPCNFVVQEQSGAALVAANDPVDQISPEDENSVRTAEAARVALHRVLTKVSEPGSDLT